ncbi:MAG TPA: hypothetical protein VFI29_15730, partial [Hanamia sp.]|nr:hypothetical protein [Hanamia sp.]
MDYFLMLWIILLLIILFLAWILLSTLEFKIDTRVPVMMIQWRSIGKATLLFEDEEWWLQIRVLFFYKKWNLMQMIFADKKKKRKVGQIRREKSNGKHKFILKFFKMIKTFQIVKWEMAISTGDNAVNARLYWLNFFLLTSR